MEGGWETAVLSCGGRCKDFAQFAFKGCNLRHEVATRNTAVLLL